MREPYSTDKILYHPLHLRALREDTPIAPIHVQMIPTNVCNQRCNFCSYRQPGYTSNEGFDCRQSIPFSKLAEIVNDCEAMGVRAIQLTGGGEPACHPQFLSLCEIILDTGIDLGIVTNGSRWTEAHVDLLRQARWVRFSLDAGCGSTYGKIRGVEPRVYDSVREIIRLLASQQTRPTVGIGFVVNRENWMEVLPAVEAARDDGVDNIRLSAVFQQQGAGYFRDFGEAASLLCKETESLSTDKFKAFNFFDDRVKDLALGRPAYDSCWISRLCTYIGADMNVYRCCVYAYNRLGLLGNLTETTFHEMWTRPKTQEALHQFDPRTCTRCMFNDKNYAIQAAIKQDNLPTDNPPDHVNFI